MELFGFGDIRRSLPRISSEFRSKWVEHKIKTHDLPGIPVISSIREGRFEDCPKMGEALNYPDPDILCGDGVVVPYKGKRYRFKFNWNALGDGTQFKAPDEKAYVSFEETSDPLTNQSKSEERFRSLRVFGEGRTQQDDTAPLLDGALPACLAVFETGDDFTWTVMAHLDDNGMPYITWLEGSCT